jgi:alpha-1,2-mannosyltransferase
LAAPLVLLYDKLVLLVAIGWMVRDGRESGFLPWEKSVLLAAYLASIVEYVAGSAWHLPIGPLISAAVLLLAVRRGARSALRGRSWSRGGLRVRHSGMMPPSTL